MGHFMEFRPLSRTKLVKVGVVLLLSSSLLAYGHVGAPAPLVSAQGAAAIGQANKQVISIIGDQACQSDVNQALKLLDQRATADYHMVERYIAVIQCVPQGSGMYAYETKPRFAVGTQERNAGPIWLAGTIVHDATHSELYHQYQAKYPFQPVPDDAWGGRAAETTCIAAQTQALREVGGSQAQIDYLQTTLSTNYWDVPVASRTW